MVIGSIKLLLRIRDPKIIKVSTEALESCREDQTWLIRIVRPIIYHHAPGLRLKQAVKDGTWSLVHLAQVHHALRCQVSMVDEVKQARIHSEAGSSFVLFDQRLPRLLRVLKNGCVIPIFVVRLKVSLSGGSDADSRSTLSPKMLQLSIDFHTDEAPNRIQSCLSIAVHPHLRTTQVPDGGSQVAVPVEDHCRSQAQPLVVEIHLLLPARWIATQQGMKVLQQSQKQESIHIGSG